MASPLRELLVTAQPFYPEDLSSETNCSLFSTLFDLDNIVFISVDCLFLIDDAWAMAIESRLMLLTQLGRKIHVLCDDELAYSQKSPESMVLANQCFYIMRDEPERCSCKMTSTPNPGMVFEVSEIEVNNWALDPSAISSKGHKESILQC